MTNNYSRRWLFLPLICMSLIVSACQPPSGQPAADGASSPAPQASEAGPVPLDLELGTGPFFLADPRTGLAELSSYKATLTVTFEGTGAGEAQQWVSTYVMLHSKEPLTRLLTIENSGDIPTADPAFLGEADGSAFEIGTGGKCSVNVIDPEASIIELLEPAGLLSALLGADEVGQEDLSGLTADHYTFDERALMLAGLAESSGEIWVAADGGHILKYVLTNTGGADYFGEGVEGSLTWDYALSEINSPLAMELPAACLEILVSAPRLPDASNVINQPGWLGYETTASVAEVAAFYQEQLPPLGWTPPIESIIADTDAYLAFTQGDQTLEVMIGTGESGTIVDILLSSAEE